MPEFNTIEYNEGEYNDEALDEPLPPMIASFNAFLQANSISGGCL